MESEKLLLTISQELDALFHKYSQWYYEIGAEWNRTGPRPTRPSDPEAQPGPEAQPDPEAQPQGPGFGRKLADKWRGLKDKWKAKWWPWIRKNILRRNESVTLQEYLQIRQMAAEIAEEMVEDYSESLFTEMDFPERPDQHELADKLRSHLQQMKKDVMNIITRNVMRSQEPEQEPMPPRDKEPEQEPMPPRDKEPEQRPMDIQDDHVAFDLLTTGPDGKFMLKDDKPLTKMRMLIWLQRSGVRIIGKGSAEERKAKLNDITGGMWGNRGSGWMRDVTGRPGPKGVSEKVNNWIVDYINQQNALNEKTLARIILKRLPIAVIKIRAKVKGGPKVTEGDRPSYPKWASS